jgi:glycosyltransferase involved in cell wall biosynthesis
MATAPAAIPSGLALDTLRVCVITDCAHGVGGMQRTTHDLVQVLTRAGNSVDVICPTHPTLDPAAYGATWHLVDTPGRTDRRWREKFRETFLAAHRARPFDVVHSESSAAHGLLFKPRVPTPIVVRYHGNYTSLSKAHLRRAWTRPRTAPGEIRALLGDTRMHFARGNAWIFRDCLSISVSHDQVGPNSRSSFVPRSLVHVVPNAIDPELFRPRERAPLRRKHGLPGGRLLVTAGRIDREKGFDVAVQALAAIGARYPDVHLLVIGEGHREQPLRELAEELGVADRVTFSGAKPPDQVAELLAASDIFLFPTLRHEAGPIVLLEGMACGLPTIASRLGGVTEVVAPSGRDSAGILVPPDDAGQLASALRSLLDDEELALALGRRARERILEEYTLERLLERTLQVYRLAIERADRAAG